VFCFSWMYVNFYFCKMTSHKIKPKLKEYKKLNLLSSSKKKLYFFSPEFSYLSSRVRSKISYIFTSSLKSTNRFRLHWGMHKKSHFKRNILETATSAQHLQETDLCSRLERRLDILLFRCGVTSSLFESKQLIAHKKIKINNKSVTCFSTLVKKGDIVSFASSISLKVKKNLNNQIKSRSLFFTNFSHVEINWQNLKIVVLSNNLLFSKHLHFRIFLFDWKSFLYK
jgi:ribosomal protein S4